jgi:phosphohistidine phosphatase SixA
MFLYLLRHGEASRPGPGKPSSLTPKGKADVTKMAEHLRGKKIQIGRVWHSPIARAAQTAEIFMKVLGVPDMKREEKEAISPDGDAQAVYHEIIRSSESSLLVVSHLPFLPNLSSYFLKDCPGAPAGLDFPTASMAAFELTQTRQWLWRLDPQSMG